MGASLSKPRTFPYRGRAVKPQTLAFNERLNKWTTFYSFYPEMYQNSSQGMFSFHQGGMYKMFDSGTHNEFFNNQQFNFYNSPEEEVENLSNATAITPSSYQGGGNPTVDLGFINNITDDSFEYDNTGNIFDNFYSVIRLGNGGISAGDYVEISFTVSNYSQVEGFADMGIAGAAYNSIRVSGNGNYRGVIQAIGSNAAFYIRRRILTANVTNIRIVNLSANNPDEDYSEIHYVSNVAPVQPKIYKNISISGTSPWVVMNIENERNQSTNNLLRDYKEKEGMYYAPIYRNIASKGGLMSGDDIRSQTLIVKLRNSLKSAAHMFATGLGYVFSGRHGR